MKQKIAALALRREVQARDVFDLALIARRSVGTSDLVFLRRKLDDATLNEARNRALTLSFGQYRDTVVEFLDPAERVSLATERAWDDQRLFAVDLIDANRRSGVGERRYALVKRLHDALLREVLLPYAVFTSREVAERTGPVWRSCRAGLEHWQSGAFSLGSLAGFGPNRGTQTSRRTLYSRSFYGEHGIVRTGSRPAMSPCCPRSVFTA